MCVLTDFFIIAAALCVDTIPSGGYECVPRPNVTSVLIVSGLKNDPGFLDDFLQSYLEKLLVSHIQITVNSHCLRLMI